MEHLGDHLGIAAAGQVADKRHGGNSQTVAVSSSDCCESHQRLQRRDLDGTSDIPDETPGLLLASQSANHGQYNAPSGLDVAQAPGGLCAKWRDVFGP